MRKNISRNVISIVAENTDIHYDTTKNIAIFSIIHKVKINCK